MTDSLFQEPEKDGFKQESPIRAFTDFKQGPVFAVGKGFRPSLAHITEYLNAMATKEGWYFKQVLESASGAPTFIFQREPDPAIPSASVIVSGMSQEGAKSFKKLLDAYEDGAPMTVRLANVSDDPPALPVVDPEKQHWTEIKWPLEAKKVLEVALATAYTDRIMNFFNAEQVVGSSHFLKVASVAAMRRALDAFVPGWDMKLVEVPEGNWQDHGSNLPIPDDRYMECAEHVLKNVVKPEFLKSAINDFRKRFAPPKNHACTSHEGIYAQLQFVLTHTKPEKIKKLIDDFRVSCAPEVTSERTTGKHPALGMGYTGGSKRSGDPYKAIAEAVAASLIVPSKDEAAPVAADPINPKHYAGRACADIGERLSANGYQVLKYVWRLGKKDDPCVEIGKSIWYGESELALISLPIPAAFARVNAYVWGLPGDDDGQAWFEERIADQSQFTQNIARMLWAGYDAKRLGLIIEALKEQQFHLDCGRGLAV